MTDQAPTPATPAMQVHIAHEMVLLGIKPFTSPSQHEEALRWLGILFGYAKIGADIRATQLRMENALTQFRQASQVQKELSETVTKVANDGTD